MEVDIAFHPDMTCKWTSRWVRERKRRKEEEVVALHDMSAQIYVDDLEGMFESAWKEGTPDLDAKVCLLSNGHPLPCHFSVADVARFNPCLLDEDGYLNVEYRLSKRPKTGTREVPAVTRQRSECA